MSGEAFERLTQIMARLRAPGGCPWDRKQTLESLRPYLVEETYEALDAIDRQDWDHLAEELGDVLLQVVFQAEIARETGLFDINDVVRSITEKLRGGTPMGRRRRARYRGPSGGALGRN
jgi:uncharacterized protein YabN with tetrapyrrole methylase and pyrophosphatase domain